MPAKKSTDPAPADPPPSFEEALEALESLVDEMEGDGLPLERMIVDYEKGVRLRDVCEKRLAEAQAKIEQIRDRGGEGETATLEDFSAAAETGASGSAGSRSAEAATASRSVGVTDESDGELF